MTYIHGPTAVVAIVAYMLILNRIGDTGYSAWQVTVFSLTALILAAPIHAIYEYFGINRHLSPLIRRLWDHAGRPVNPPIRPVSIKLRNKLIYLAVFTSSVPLIFFAVTIVFRVELLFDDLGIAVSFAEIWPLLAWIAGVVAVFLGSGIGVSLLTARELTGSASRLISAMDRVERGDLDNFVHVTGTDEFADLFRGFNMMTDSLREEVQILEMSHDLAGELNLEVLLARIMRATTELLNADRSTLFLHDRASGELWSRVAEGIATKEIRIPGDAGIAGAAFSSGRTENIPDPYSDPRFNRTVDQEIGYQTASILCMPIFNKQGQRIGVTQVLNKHGGAFTAKDEGRLGAFNAQIAVALENAQLFEDVLREKNYNDAILQSTSNGIFTLDLEDRVLTANDAVFQILERPSAEIISQPASELFSGSNLWLFNSLQKVGRTGEQEITVEAELETGSEATASVNASVSPLIDAMDESIGSMVVLEDITTEKRVKSTMARYMSAEVADQLLESGEAELGGKDQLVSILFSDIRGFTTISEALGARDTVSMLNDYFEAMVDSIMERQGVLDKFIGDAIMALFGVPFNGEQDSDDAVRAAIGMQIALRAHNEQRQASGRDPIQNGIGISSGPVIVGNIGSTKRMEYTVIGDPVNLSSRIESATRFYGANILISEYTKAAMRNGARLREIDLMQVKGKTEPVSLFEVLDHHTHQSFPNLSDVLDAYSGGLTAYRQREWQTALGGFDAALAAHPNDKPSQIYAERCRRFLTTPPPQDWNGVYIMNDK